MSTKALRNLCEIQTIVVVQADFYDKTCCWHSNKNEPKFKHFKYICKRKTKYDKNRLND